MNFPKVSIITPSYNQAQFLEATIQSVLRQEYPNLEYIVVDGGSTDGSVEIIRHYQEQIAWWVSEPDRGQADAINKGFRQATGEIVAWLNSDDIYLPGAILDAVRQFENSPDAGLIYGDALSIDGTGRPFNALRFPDWNYDDLLRFHIICQPSVFICHSALKLTGYLDENYHFMLDHALWLKLAAETPIHHTPHLWSAARQHGDAKNVAQAAAFSQEILNLLEEIETKPTFALNISRDRNRIVGGAYRLAARYYLDGNMARKAIAYYGKALIHWPGYALKHWHRILYAFLSLLGGKSLAMMYYTRVSKRKSSLAKGIDTTDWPGLSFGEGPE